MGLWDPADASGPAAQQFTTGSNTGGYALSEITVNFGLASTAAVPALSIYTSVNGDQGGHIIDYPGSKVVDLTGSVATAGEQSFTPVSATTLSASTKYFVVLSSTGDVLYMQYTNSNNVDAGAAAGWGIKNKTLVTIASVWGEDGPSIEIAVKGTAVAAVTNNAPEFTDGASTTRSVAENTAAGNNVGTAVAATDDDSDTLTYTLGGTDASSFDITGTSGQILTSAALDHEAAKNSYSVTVNVSDGNGGSDSIAVTINVTDVNEKPATPGAPTVSATSNTTDSLDVSWTAPGLNGGPELTGYEVQYRISGSWTSWSHSGTGTTATITGLTASTSYDVQVRALNGETPSDWSLLGHRQHRDPHHHAPQHQARS